MTGEPLATVCCVSLSTADVQLVLAAKFCQVAVFLLLKLPS